MRPQTLKAVAREPTVVRRKRLPKIMPHGILPAVGCLLRQPWLRQLATDEINLSKVQCQGIMPSYQSASQAWQHWIRIHDQCCNLNLGVHLYLHNCTKYP